MTQDRKKLRMTSAEFAAVRPLLNISDDRIDAAYAALVRGDVLQSIADEYGWTRQAVNNVAKVVWSTFQAYKLGQQAELMELNSHLPDGWEMLFTPAPTDLIEDFKKRISDRRQSLSTTPKKRESKKGAS